MKKLLSYILSLVMVVSLFPLSAITAYAAETEEISIASESEYEHGTIVGNTLYVYQGKITKGELYNALVAKYGSGTYKYADAKPTLSWSLGGTEVKSGQTGTISLSGGTLYVGKKKSTFSWTDYTFPVQTYGYTVNFPTLERATVHMDGNVQAGEQHVTLKAAILAGAVKDWGDYAGITPTVYAYDDGTLSTGWHKLEWFIDSALTSGIYPATASRPIKFEWPATGDLPAYTVEAQIVFSDHNRTSNPVVTAPTCTEKGYTTYTCDCGLFTTKSAETAALGHTAGAEATCTAAQTCTVCGEQLVAAFGHAWVDATYEAPKTCTTCGATEGERKEGVLIPDNVTGEVVEEIRDNTALNGYVPKNLPTGTVLIIKLVSAGDTIVYDVTPIANGVKVEPTEVITFRLPVPASETAKLAKVYHDGDLMGTYAIQGEDNEKYVEVSSADFSEFKVEPIRGLAGSGTQTDPYQIATIEDLILFRDSVNAGETKYNAEGVYVVLTADIDMANATWERGIGDGINATFDGIFDGKDFAIKNLNLAPEADSDKYFCGGLFGYTYGAAVIKNVVLENITVTAEGEGHNVGALVGFANNNGGKLTVSNVTVKNVTINAPGAYGVGAIVGYSYRAMGTIENCTVDGATINGYSFVGGITGYSYNNAVIKDCSVENATITATSKGAGGIVGISLSGNNIIGNTVADTTVTAQTNWGYVVGEVASEGIVVENNNAAMPQVGGSYATGEAVQAMIGSKYYTTFAAAFAAAQDDETITLLAPIVVDAGETLTLDKNVTITYTSTVEGEDMITVRGILNVAAGKITYINNSNGSNVTVSTISAEAGSVVNVTGGMIENKSTKADNSSSYPYAIDLLTNANLGDVTVNISDGTVYSDYMAIRQFNNGTACKNTLNVTGGKIYGAKRAIQIHMDNNAAYLAISGGVVEAGEGGYALCLYPKTSTNIDISGGKFIGTIYSGTNNIISGGNFSEEAYAGYLADGLILAKNTDGTYSVAVPVASVNGVSYATLAEAIKAAASGAEITLLADVTENVTIDKNLTIDGAGKNYKGNIAVTGSSVAVTNLVHPLNI